MEKNTKNKGNNSRKHESLLSDFLECECGENITGVVKKKQGFKSYGCRSKEVKYKESNRKINPCSNRRTMNMDKTNELVVNEITKVVSDSSILKEKFKEDVMKNKKQTEKLRKGKGVFLKRLFLDWRYSRIVSLYCYVIISLL